MHKRFVATVRVLTEHGIERDDTSNGKLLHLYFHRLNLPTSTAYLLEVYFEALAGPACLYKHTDKYTHTKEALSYLYGDHSQSAKTTAFYSSWCDITASCLQA